MLNNVSLQFYMSNEDSRGLKLVFFYGTIDTNYYDVLRRHLILSRGYELIEYRSIGVTKNFLSFGMI